MEPTVEPTVEPTAAASGASGATSVKKVREDWEWRRRIRSNQHSHRIYKWVVGIVGAAVAIGGLFLVPLPGPGWLIVFLGIGILASEFEWAHRLLGWGKARLRDWNTWLRPKPLWFKGLVGLATLAVVCLIFYAYFSLAGVPGFLPDVVEDPLRTYLKL